MAFAIFLGWIHVARRMVSRSAGVPARKLARGRSRPPVKLGHNRRCQQFLPRCFSLLHLNSSNQLLDCSLCDGSSLALSETRLPQLAAVAVDQPQRYPFVVRVEFPLQNGIGSRRDCIFNNQRRFAKPRNQGFAQIAAEFIFAQRLDEYAFYCRQLNAGVSLN